MPAMGSPSVSLTLVSQRSFLAWLALAVLLHGLLLLLPDGRRVDGEAVLKTLSVTLRKPLQPRPEPESQPSVAETLNPESRPLAPPAEPMPLPADPGRIEAAPRIRNPVDPAPEPEPLLTPPLSAARLFESTQRLRLPTYETEQTDRLGRQPLAAPPPNWRSGQIPGASRFYGRALPERVEIVDRWLAADGSHNVLVETPSGEMYCGRASAWDPLQPLVEPVMMFRACGGGRKTFEWPEEYEPRPAGTSAREMEP